MAGYNQTIVVSRSSDLGQSWEAPTIAAGSWSGPPAWAPVLFYDTPSSRLAMVWQQTLGGTFHGVAGGDVLLQTSLDLGRTWSPASVIFPWSAMGGSLKIALNRLIRMPDGSLLLPFNTVPNPAHPTGSACSNNSDCAGALVAPSLDGPWQPVGVQPVGEFAFYSENAIERCDVDHQGWSLRGSVSASSAMMMTMPPSSSDEALSLLQVFRTRRGVMFQSQSATSSGQGPWSQPAPVPAVPNPDSRNFLYRQPPISGASVATVVLATNPNATSRIPLTLFSTSDCGASYHRYVDIETSPQPGGGIAHYPAVVSASGSLFITYTYDSSNNGNGIKLAIVPLVSQ